MSDPSSLPSGWFPDPLDRYDHRYFNGRTWTSDVSSGGERFVDPLGTTPNAPGKPGTSNGAATAAVVMGSVGVAIAWIPFIVLIGAALAVLAIVFGSIGLRRSRISGVGKRASVAGIVMGSLGVIASIVGVVLSVMVFREVIRFAEPGPVATDVTACSIDGRRATVDGTVTNLDDQTRSYTLFVEIDGRTGTVVVDDVDADESVAWSTVVNIRSGSSECDPTIVVQGPFPYGIEVDPVN